MFGSFQFRFVSFKVSWVRCADSARHLVVSVLTLDVIGTGPLPELALRMSSNTSLPTSPPAAAPPPSGLLCRHRLLLAACPRAGRRRGTPTRPAAGSVRSPSAHPPRCAAATALAFAVLCKYMSSLRALEELAMLLRSLHSETSERLYNTAASSHPLCWQLARQLLITLHHLHTLLLESQARVLRFKVALVTQSFRVGPGAGSQCHGSKSTGP
jgi:hypothetical protein